MYGVFPVFTGFNNDGKKQTVEVSLQDLKKQIESRLRKPKNEVKSAQQCLEFNF